MKTKTLHRWNALFLAAFIIIHMANHVSGLWGIATYNSVQDALRVIYRNLFVEPVLLTSCVLQILIGGQLIYRKFRHLTRTGWGKLQVASGGFFLFFLTEHLLALVLARWVDGLGTDFYWPASVMNGPPFTWYFIPYYFLGVASVFTHIGCALRLALVRAGYKHFAVLVALMLILIGVVLGTLIVSILLGSFFEINLPEKWVSYLRRFVSGYQPY